MDAVVGKMGRNFIVAAFVPALAFASFSLFIFSPIIPNKIATLLKESLAPLDHPVLLLLMITIVIGFSLHSLNTTIYKVLEGYFLLPRISIIGKFQKKKAAKTYLKIRFLEKLYNTLLDPDSDATPEQIDEVKAKLYQLSATFQRNYPLSIDLMMPTRFGNAFRALEIYPRLRYRMDAVLIWPRLIQVIPNEYYLKLDDSNNRLAFLVNCAMLSFGMSILCSLAAGYQLLMLRWAQLGKQPIYFINVIENNSVKYQQNAYIYMFGVVIMMGLFVLFYRASIPIIIQYGDLVKSAFDLFRLRLIDELNLKSPSHYPDEIQIWENLSFFIGHGWLNNDIETVPFAYDAAEEILEDVDVEFWDE